MTNPTPIDPERLAALIDGRLSASEAAAVREQLAHADDDTLAAYADAVAVHAELSKPVAGVLPRRTWLSRPVVGALIAAGLVTVVVLARRGQETHTPASWPQVQQLALDVPAGGATAEQSWGAVRGEGGVSERARSVRVGVLLADVTLARREGRDVTPYYTALADLMSDVPGAAQVVGSLRGTAGGNVAPQPRPVEETLYLMNDGDLVATGVWLESARTAMTRGDNAYLTRHPLPELRGSSSAVDSLAGIVRERRDRVALEKLLQQLTR